MEDRLEKSIGPHVCEFVEKYCVHTIGSLSGKPLILEAWQCEFINDMYTVFWNGRGWQFLYPRTLLGVPRGAGKSTLAAALCLYALSPFGGRQAPRVINAAATREQAKHVYDTAKDMVLLSSRLQDVFTANKNVIYCPDNRGQMFRVSGEGKSNFGGNPSFTVRDELHVWLTEKQKQLSEALMTALAKQENSQALTVTTAGYDKSSELGELYDWTLKHPDLETRLGTYIVRDPKAGTLVWWFEAPKDLPWDAPETWRLANPSSHISTEAIRGVFEDPSVGPDEFKRQFLNQWSQTRSAWLPTGLWQSLKTEESIPQEARIQLAIDASLTSDSTALSWAWAKDDESPVLIDSYVWSAVESVAHDKFIPGGRIDLRLVVQYITDVLNPQFQITEIVYDPRFFDTLAQDLSDLGFVVAPMIQGSEQMADAYQSFYTAARTEQLRHTGNEVLAEHVESTGAVQTERGWKVFKLKNTKRIDATVASVMAFSRAKADLINRNRKFTYRRSELFPEDTNVQA